MTEYSRHNNNGRYTISVNNHTRTDVCNSVSTLTNVLVQSLIYLKYKNIIANYKYNLERGKCDITFEEYITNNNLAHQQLITTIDVIETGFKMLEKTYHEYVKTFIV